MSALSLSQAKAHLNITQAADDAEIQRVIDAAEAAIANRVGPLEPVRIVRRVRPTNGVLVLPVMPVVDVTSLSDYSGSALTVGDLYLDAEAGVLGLSTGGLLSSAHYTVTYRAGRATVPADLMQAVKELVAHLWDGSQRAVGRTRSTDDSDRVAGAYLLSYRVQSMLQPHSLPSWA